MKITQTLGLVAVSLAFSCSYCYSEEIAGTTTNAAANGVIWNMDNVLPPQAGLVVNNMFYRYTTDKNPSDPFTVTIQNEHLTEDGYVIQETDDWSGLPPGTIVKRVDLPNIPREIIGEGSISTTGKGEVLNPNVVYSYKYDPCYVVIQNPECPGYNDALYAWLLENGFLDNPPSPGDPFYDEWVQASLNRETEPDQESDEEREEREKMEEDAKKDKSIEKLNQGITIDGLVDGQNQNDLINAMSTIPNFDTYTTATIQGGVYEETITLDGGELNDNTRALNNLAQDSVHRDMVRSQYNDNN
jgi:hypothetical protein